VELAIQTSVAPKPRKNKHEGARTLPKRLGRYMLFDHIGRGGMADIYLARAKTDFDGGRLVCIKEVLAKYATSPGYSDMLVTEAKLAAELSHANVVTVYDLGRDEGSLYIAMEYVEGYDLRELLRRCASDKVPLPVEFGLLVVTEVLRALSYAHRFRGPGAPKGIIHRDVSPSNMLISFQGEVKLCDFGIARANEATKRPAETENEQAELDSAIAGKAGYMSPEQARGETVDGRSDVFAAGIVLWELCAGRRLYKAGPDESLLEVARRAAIPPLPLRELHDEPALHAIVRKALAKDANDRYGSASEMLRELEDYASRARLVGSPLRFGEWLLEHFGKDLVASRRGRERALRAIERGPVALVRAIEPQPAPAPVAPPVEPAPSCANSAELSPADDLASSALDEPNILPERSQAIRLVHRAPPRRPGFVAYFFALLLVAFALLLVTAR
jgi:serine/threonine protein kinase